MQTASPRLSLDDLSALCEEIAALIRAGVPLETALGRRAGDLPWRLSRAVGDLSERLSSGESLEGALRSDANAFPPVFTALVAAGARTGRMSAALAGLTATARSLADLRQSVMSAMAYPMTVALVAYGALAFLAVWVIPSLAMILTDFQLVPPSWMNFVVWLGRRQGIWWLVPPVALAVLAFWWWYRSAQGEILSGRGAWTVLWLRPARQMLRDARWSAFSDLMALMVEHDVPLGEALRLASAAGGDKRLVTAANALAAEIERGGMVTDAAVELEGLPPLVRIAFSAPQWRTPLAANLRAVAEHYRRGASERSYWLRTFLPSILTLALGGTTVAVIVAMIAWPWMRIVWYLTKEAMQ
ncbi:MAG: type II secretion system F family protein [Planctomycetes bacterium]|nr:type II secretion system F family protein [Planctomycetota bacterium]